MYKRQRYNRAGGTIEFTSKKGEGTTFVVTIAMTANAFIEDINQSREVGMNEHFSKPLNMETVSYTHLRRIGRSFYWNDRLSS